MQRSPHFRYAIELIGASYLRWVPKTCKLIVYPSRILDRVDDYWPCILATWHGQCYILPFTVALHKPIQILVSGSRDGQILQRVLAPYGFEVIVGSGAGSKPKEMIRKRGFAAFVQMLSALKSGCAIVSTADTPKKARVAGLGPIKLASCSGRPIVPIAVMTSHRYILRNWDCTVINLPFGRAAVVIGDPIFVEDTNDASVLENRRIELEFALNLASAKARELASYWRSRRSRSL